MKIVSQEIYKEYEIVARAEFKEDTTKYIMSETENLDSVKFEVTARKGVNYFETLRGSVEEKKSKKRELYDAFNSKLKNLIETAKKNIDKKIREEEMTGGLPESLLQGGYVGDLRNNGKLVTLHESERFLNEEETKAILDSVQITNELIKKHKNDSKESAESNLFNSIYDICIQVIKDTDEEKARELTSAVIKALNRDLKKE